MHLYGARQTKPFSRGRTMNGDSRDDLRSRSVALEALSDRKRREVVRTLRRTSDSAFSLEELADAVRSRQHDATNDDELEVRLHHVDLPKLNEADFVDYDPRNKTARYRSHALAEDVLTAFD